MTSKCTHDYNEEVVISTTATEKATQQHYEWLRPRPRCWQFGHIDLFCTRASNMGTSKSTRTDWSYVTHTRFSSDY